METMESAITRTKAMIRRITNTCNFQLHRFLCIFLYIFLHFFTFPYVSLYFFTFLKFLYLYSPFFTFLYISIYFFIFIIRFLPSFSHLTVSLAKAAIKATLRNIRRRSSSVKRRMKKEAKKFFQFCQGSMKKGGQVDIQ